MNLFSSELHSSFQAKKAIKVITGIDRTDISKIIDITKAAELSGCTYVDVVANPKVVKLVKSVSSLPICVSSIDPIELYNCVVAGANLIEIGNFDFCYKQGIYLTSVNILQLTRELKYLMNNIDLCVTIPYYLSISEQVKLAQELEFLGVSIIQTESMFIKNKLQFINCNNSNTFSSAYPSYSSLLSTYFISKYVDIPIITSSSLNTITSSMALLFGASGIGVGSIIRNQNNLMEMYQYLKSLRISINLIADQQFNNLHFLHYSSSRLYPDTIKNLLI
uniref:Uncharacterized protein ycf23 n=1 Tax=Osmundea sinicola TaxID=290685 RepID=A0A7L4WNL1_9FLOR|nr:hypothetical protein [Osmundea sinicola]QFR99844.1 hypothetical protein [Osmundea sinicola]